MVHEVVGVYAVGPLVQQTAAVATTEEEMMALVGQADADADADAGAVGHAVEVAVEMSI